MLVRAAIVRWFQPGLVGLWIRMRALCGSSSTPRYVWMAFPSPWVKAWEWVCMVGVDLFPLVRDVVVGIAGAW